jgi:hypothetical protein
VNLKPRPSPVGKVREFYTTGIGEILIPGKKYFRVDKIPDLGIVYAGRNTVGG